MQDNTFHKINQVIAENEALAESRESFITEGGVVLKLHKVSQNLVNKLMTKFPDPVPPMIYMDDREERVPNYADPQYNSDITQNTLAKTLAAQSLWFANGVTIVTVPAGVLPWEGDEWLEGKEFIKEDLPIRGPGRMAAWLMFHAIPGDEEQVRLMLKIQMLGGQVTEAMADAAMEAFRGGPERGPNTEAENTTADTPGNSLPAPTPITGTSV